MFKFGILGVGKMGGSILNGILNSKIYKKEEMLLCVHSDEQSLSLINDGFVATTNPFKLFTECELILLAIKPQMFPQVLCDTNKYDFNNKGIISIAAGISINALESYFPNASIVRAMPNTPALINKGVTTICSKENNDILAAARNIFNSIGTSSIIAEEEMDASLPLNGSMPAYLYYFAKLFIDEAVKNNIDYDTAVDLTANSIIASAEMILKSSDDIDTLIKNVCSKGGTTIAGLNKLDDRFKDSIKDCYNACMNRSKELSK